MIIYVCYFDYGDWDNNSHPVQFFLNEQDAIDWKSANGPYAVYSKMTLGKDKLPR